MLDAFLIEALGRLDAWLIEVCVREEARARKLAPEGAAGWLGVQAMVRPSAAELALDDTDPPDLIPQGDHPLRIAAESFHLEKPLDEALLVLLAPHIEPRYTALYAVLQDNLQQPWTTERLLLAVLGRTAERRRILLEALGEAGRLVGSGLVTVSGGPQPPLSRPLDLAPDVRGALLGLEMPSSLEGAPITRFPVRVMNSEEPAPFVVIFGSGEWRREVDAIAGDMPGGVLVLGAIEERAPALAGGQAALRLGALHRALPIVDLTGLNSGVDASVAMDLRRRVEAFGGRLVVRAREPLPLPVPQRQAKTPPFAARRAAWISEAMRRGVTLGDDAGSRLASTFRFGESEVADAFETSHENTEEQLRTAASRLVRVSVRHAAEVLATRTFEDLVVRDTARAALERLVYFALHRDRLAEDRGLEGRFRLRRGPLALFSGLSGTGKTLAAEVVANALGRPFYVVDLSRLVSKYIGETEKHISEVLSDAERAGVVLFFDEADALFSARTEVSTSNDRYANLEVGYLLQRVEHHDGLVILATNLRHSIDEAFLRRFQFRIEFPFPEAAERHGIWERMLPPGVSRAADVDLSALAKEHRLSGGEIANAALKAIFLAEQEGEALDQRHLERAVALELLELGRLSRRDAGAMDPDRGALLRRFVEIVAERLATHLRGRFIKEIHVVHGAPTKEALSGRRPAVSVALYRIAISRSGGLKLGLVISAWSHRAEEEHELLGAAYEALPSGDMGDVLGRRGNLRLQESHDFDLLYRFWSSHGHPVRASLVVDGEVG